MKLEPIYSIINVSNVDAAIVKVRSYIKAGLKIIQLRDKVNDFKTQVRINQAVVSFRNDVDPDVLVITNDDPFIALESGTDGVHLGQTDVDPSKARELLGDGKVIGLSCHNLHDLENAPTSLLDYLACGPIFYSSTKNGHAEIVGLDNLKAFCTNSSLPTVAIGGITARNATSVFMSGASSCAMISELESTPQLEDLVCKFKGFLNLKKIN